MFPQNPRDIEDACLEEEEEYHPLVVPVGHYLLPWQDRSHPWVGLVLTYLVVVTNTILLLGCS